MNTTDHTTPYVPGETNPRPYQPLKQQIKDRFNALLDEVLDQIIVERDDPNHWLAVTTSIPKGPIGGAVAGALGAAGIGGAVVDRLASAGALGAAGIGGAVVDRLASAGGAAISGGVGAKGVSGAIDRVESALDSLEAAVKENEKSASWMRSYIEADLKNPFRGLL